MEPASYTLVALVCSSNLLFCRPAHETGHVFETLHACQSERDSLGSAPPAKDKIWKLHCATTEKAGEKGDALWAMSPTARLLADVPRLADRRTVTSDSGWAAQGLSDRVQTASKSEPDGTSESSTRAKPGRATTVAQRLKVKPQRVSVIVTTGGEAGLTSQRVLVPRSASVMTR